MLVSSRFDDLDHRVEYRGFRAWYLLGSPSHDLDGMATELLSGTVLVHTRLVGEKVLEDRERPLDRACGRPNTFSSGLSVCVCVCVLNAWVKGVGVTTML